MSTSKKWEEFNLDEALFAAESGDVGQVLKGVAGQIEPRADFARHLEARLQDGTPVYGKGTLPGRPPQEATIGSEPLAVKWRHRFEQIFSRQARGTSMRAAHAARVVLGLVGIVGMFVILIGMAQMLKMRNEVSRNNGTPTAFTGGTGDSRALADSFELLHTIKPEPIKGYHGEPLLMKWSPDGQTLATGAGTSVELWSRATGQSLAKFDTPIVRSLAWSRGGALVAVGTEENKVFLVDSQMAAIRSTLVGPFAAPLSFPVPGASAPAPVVRAEYGEVSGLAWSPDGSMVASLADEAPLTPTPQPKEPRPGGPPPTIPDRPIQIIRIWDVRTGKQVRAITVPPATGGSRYYNNLSWSPDGGTLASFTMAGPIRLWDPRTGQQRHQLNVDKGNSIGDVQWSPDGQVLSVVASRVVQLWDVKSGQVRYTLPQSLPTMPPLPEPIPTLILPQPVPSTAATPLATRPPVTPYVEPTPAPDGYYYVSNVHWSADGKSLSVLDLNHIRRWEASTGRLMETTLTTTFWHRWSPDGRMLASGDGGVKLGDSVTGELLRTLSPHLTTNLEWSHDARMIAFSKLDEKRDDKRETRIILTEIELWGIRSLATVGPESTSTPDTRTSLPVINIPATETSVATPTVRDGTVEVEPTPGMIDTPTSTGTSTTVTSPTASPDPRRICSGWSVVDSPSVDTVSELQAVAAVSSNDVWAVGYSSTDDVGWREGTPVPSVERTLIMHWDGTKWSTVPSPSLGKTTNRLESVAVVSKDDVWAVGYYSDGPEFNQPLTTSQTIVLHWDGQAWKDVHSPDGKGAAMSTLSYVAAISKDDIWAVGAYGSYEASEKNQSESPYMRTFITHWDGKRWSQVDSPNPSAISNGLSAVAAVSSDDIWAVGTYVESMTEGGYVTRRLLFLRWNGKAWERVAEPDIQGYFLSLSSLAAIKPDDVWAVGSVGSGDPELAGTIVHWDGKSWRETPDSQKEYGSTAGFRSVAALGSNDIWTVSGAGFPTLHHWDGQGWNMVFPNGLPDSYFASVNGLAAVSTNDIWAIGTTDYHGTPRGTLILHYSGPGCVTPAAEITTPPSP